MNKIKLIFCFVLICIFSNLTIAQNIFSGEPIQVVGAYNGYVTTPYNSDYRTATYRRVTTSTGNPIDGRGQWKTTVNVQTLGGDVTPINMAGGSGNGFLFISGPTANRFQNKWVFSGVGQGTVDGINGISAFNSGNDMGLNMSAAGHYTFVFNDCGYTQTNARYYIGRTTNAPVTVTRSSQSVGATDATINISTNATPSTEEKIYVRYTTGTDFSGTGTSTVVQATGSGTSYTATFPIMLGQNYRYFVFSSTLTLAQLSLPEEAKFSLLGSVTETDKNLSVLNYDDNSGANYTILAPTAAQISVSGKVTNAFGRGISRARVSVTNQQGETKFVTTNQFGTYNIEDLSAGETYIFEASRKGFIFSPQVLTVNENLDGLNFVAQ
jgi:hypothetical protein